MQVALRSIHAEPKVHKELLTMPNMKNKLKREENKPNTVMQAFNPSTHEAEAGRSVEVST